MLDNDLIGLFAWQNQGASQAFRCLGENVRERSDDNQTPEILLPSTSNEIGRDRRCLPETDWAFTCYNAIPDVRIQTGFEKQRSSLVADALGLGFSSGQRLNIFTQSIQPFTPFCLRGIQRLTPVSKKAVSE